MKPARRRRALAAAKLTPRLLAELLGNSPATVRFWLRAERLPRLAHALLALLEESPAKTVRALQRSRAAEVRATYDRLAEALRESCQRVEDAIEGARRRRSPKRRRGRS